MKRTLALLLAMLTLLSLLAGCAKEPAVTPDPTPTPTPTPGPADPNPTPTPTPPPQGTQQLQPASCPLSCSGEEESPDDSATVGIGGTGKGQVGVMGIVADLRGHVLG